MSQNKDKAIGELVNVFVVTAAAVATNGYALSTLWNWYVVSAFGLPALSFKLAVGLCILWSVVGLKNNDRMVQIDDFLADAWTVVVAKWLGLGLGWAVWSAL